MGSGEPINGIMIKKKMNPECKSVEQPEMK